VRECRKAGGRELEKHQRGKIKREGGSENQIIFKNFGFILGKTGIKLHLYDEMTINS